MLLLVIVMVLVPQAQAADPTVVTTLAGDGTAAWLDATGTAAQFDGPNAVAVDTAGNLYVADAFNNRIRKIVLATGVVTTLAGDGTPGFANGTGTAAQFKNPNGVAVDTAGNLYVADSGNQLIRKIVIATGAVTTLAGDGTAGFVNGIGTAAQFSMPLGVAIDTAGNLYVPEMGNASIRKIVISSGVVTTLAGGTSGFADGIGTLAKFNGPNAVAVDTAGNNLYVADTSNHRIRQIVLATGAVTTLAGSTWGFADGTGAAAQFNNPGGVAVDTAGNLYVGDSSNHRIRKIVISSGDVTTLAGDGTGAWLDGIGTAAQFNGPDEVAIDSAGNLYVADRNNNRIRLISPPAPSGLTATAASTTQINLAWTDNNSDETGFKVYRNGTLVTTTAADAITYNDTGLTCGTTYNYQVKATNGSGDSTAATASGTTSACSGGGGKGVGGVAEVISVPTSTNGLSYLVGMAGLVMLMGAGWLLKR